MHVCIRSPFGASDRASLLLLVLASKARCPQTPAWRAYAASAAAAGCVRPSTLPCAPYAAPLSGVPEGALRTPLPGALCSPRPLAYSYRCAHAMQRHRPRSHTIIEAHPDVHRHAVAKGWDRRARLLLGRWQDVLPTLEGQKFDGIFFDTCVRGVPSQPTDGLPPPQRAASPCAGAALNRSQLGCPAHTPLGAGTPHVHCFGACRHSLRL